MERTLRGLDIEEAKTDSRLDFKNNISEFPYWKYIRLCRDFEESANLNIETQITEILAELQNQGKKLRYIQNLRFEKLLRIIRGIDLQQPNIPDICVPPEAVNFLASLDSYFDIDTYFELEPYREALKNSPHNSAEAPSRHTCLISIKFTDPTGTHKMTRIAQDMALETTPLALSIHDNHLEVTQESSGDILFTDETFQSVMKALEPVEERLWDAIFSHDLKPTVNFSVGIDFTLPHTPAMGLDGDALFFLSQLEASLCFHTYIHQPSSA